MRCNKAKTLMVFSGCAVWLAVLGWVDRATGHELDRALKESREQLKQVANATHLCPQCHRPYVPQALRAKPEESLAARTSEAVSVAPSDGRGNQFSRIC